MIAIEVRINGKLEATCGSEALRQLAAMVSARQSKDGSTISYVVECMGVRPKNAATEEVLRWLNTRIALGDEVSFKFVEAANAAAPFDSQDIPRNGGQDS
jgi:hypothetical protein